MALQYSVALRNAQLDQVETVVGTAPVMEIRSGAPPATCATADSGSVLATLTLPSDWMTAAAAGVKAKTGTWTDASADASGTPGHFRLKDSGLTATHAQGTVGTSGTDMIIDSATFTAGQVFTISTFSVTAGNA